MTSGRLPDTIRRLVELPDTERKIGSFRLKQPLGQGGFAPVWLADEVAGSAVLRQAAVKLFALERGGEARQAIIDEAARLCRLEHPNIVRFYALPVDEARAVVGLAMEYVAGKSLAQVLLERQRISVREALDVGIAIASALVAVHGAGLVHRDLHTSNVMVNEALVGSPSAYKLIDFGIAAARTAGLPGSPPSGGVAVSSSGPIASRPDGLGKRGYVDPVYWREAGMATSASDLYALGALLFVSLVGRLPAAGPDGLDQDVLSGKKSAPQVASLLPEVPAPLAELIDALLSPEREKRPRSAEVVVIELDRLRGALTGRSRSLPSEDEGPFRGLSRFEREHRDVFFGRRVEASAALEVLRTRGLLALVGPSGSGKSSLARAGILPALEDGALGGARSWEQVVVSPGMDPRQTLTTALFHVELDPHGSPEEAAARLEAWVSEQRRGLVILVDQLEELATLESDRDGLVESRTWTKDFLARICEAPRPGLRVIATARQDLLDRILEHRPLGRALMRGTVLVSPLLDAAWGEVIDASLTSYGYAFEDPDLRQELLGSLSATGDAMPLVEFALTKLWELRDRERRTITRAAWRELGGIAGALDAHANALSRAVQEERRVGEADVKRVMLSLITPAGARAPRTLKELTDDGRDEAATVIVQRFEEARLLVREASRGTRDQDRLTLAHEALIAHWGKLSAWVAEDREERLLREDLAQAAVLWAKSQDDDLLWRRRRLLLAQEILRRRGIRLEGKERKFFEASLWASRRVRIGLLSLGLVAALAASGVVYFRTQKELAEAVAGRERERAAKAEAEAEAERAETKAAKAETALERALKESALSAYRQIKVVADDRELAEASLADAGTPGLMLPSGTVTQIEKYLAAQRGPDEKVPELENIIAEPPVAPVEAMTTEDDSAPTASVEASLPADTPLEPAGQDVQGSKAEVAHRGPSAQPTHSIPLGVAYAALRGAQAKAMGCRQEDGPRGAGKLALVLAPDGHVSSVVLELPFAGTAVGQCVGAMFKAVQVQPFEGKPVTVLWSFAVR